MPSVRVNFFGFSLSSLEIVKRLSPEVTSYFTISLWQKVSESLYYCNYIARWIIVAHYERLKPQKLPSPVIITFIIIKAANVIPDGICYYHEQDSSDLIYAATQSFARHHVFIFSLLS